MTANVRRYNIRNPHHIYDHSQIMCAYAMIIII